MENCGSIVDGINCEENLFGIEMFSTQVSDLITQIKKQMNHLFEDPNSLVYSVICIEQQIGIVKKLGVPVDDLILKLLDLEKKVKIAEFKKKLSYLKSGKYKFLFTTSSIKNELLEAKDNGFDIDFLIEELMEFELFQKLDCFKKIQNLSNLKLLYFYRELLEAYNKGLNVNALFEDLFKFFGNDWLINNEL